MPLDAALDSFDFGDAYLGHSNLGGVGPDTNAAETILYRNLGTSATGVPFDLRVRTLSPYAVHNSDENRLTAGGLAKINLLGPHKGQGIAQTHVELEYCFLNGDEDSAAFGTPVTLGGFQLTFFDFDRPVPAYALTNPHMPAHARPYMRCCHGMSQHRLHRHALRMRSHEYGLT